MTDTARYLMCLGYDGAAQIGQLFAYMTMMNRGGSGGYTPTHLADAMCLDTKIGNKPNFDDLVAAHTRRRKEYEAACTKK